MIFSILLCLLSSLPLIFSFPQPDLYWLSWIALVPLFLALEKKSPRESFFIGYIWGLFFWAGLIYWLSNVTFLGYIFLVLYLALYAGIFGLLVSLVTGYWLLVTIPCAWVSLEYIRSYLFTGFGWAILGYSQYKNLPLIQIADITGAYGVSFLIVLVNLAIFQIIKSILRRKILFSGFWFLVTGFFVGTCLAYGYYRLRQFPIPNSQFPIRVSLIQGNILPDAKWDSTFKDLIFEKYNLFSQMASRENPHLIIWPETSFPGFWEEERDLRERILALAKELSTYFLIGVPTLKNNSGYNSAMLISAEGQEISRYRKVHLVPFGEYIPFAKILRFLQNRFGIGDYISGEEFTIFKITNSQFPIPNSQFSVLICFEDIFPDLVRRFIREGAEFLINITEDGWFGRTGASFQHTQAAVFRAVENRRFVVRVANTGYSCVINDKGKIVSELKDSQGNKLFITGTYTGEVVPNSTKTFYSYWGDIFAFLCVIITCVSFCVDKEEITKI